MYIYVLGIPIHHMGCLYSFNCTHVGVLVISMHTKLRKSLVVADTSVLSCCQSVANSTTWLKQHDPFSMCMTSLVPGSSPEKWGGTWYEANVWPLHLLCTVSFYVIQMYYSSHSTPTPWLSPFLVFDYFQVDTRGVVPDKGYWTDFS